MSLLSEFLSLQKTFPQVKSHKVFIDAISHNLIRVQHRFNNT